MFHLQTESSENVGGETEVTWVLWHLTAVSLYSHLEVSVYYALLMAILHGWHNLPGEGTTGEDMWGEGREERQNQNEPVEVVRDDLVHRVARHC